MPLPSYRTFDPDLTVRMLFDSMDPVQKLFDRFARLRVNFITHAYELRNVTSPLFDMWWASYFKELTITPLKAILAKICPPQELAKKPSRAKSKAKQPVSMAKASEETETQEEEKGEGGSPDMFDLDPPVSEPKKTVKRKASSPLPTSKAPKSAKKKLILGMLVPFYS